MKKEPTGVFINGKAQIVEMLQIMPAGERDQLLKNIRLRNPSLAQELSEESLSFDFIFKLPNLQLAIILKYINPTILGISLKGVDVETQKKVLGIAPRDYAEKAYHSLIGALANENRDRARAQDRVLKTVLELIKKGVISAST